MKRNFTDCPKPVKLHLYKALVRPKLEYASSVWDPHTDVCINILEAVQNRAARFIMNDYSRFHSVSNMKSSLNLPPLSQRRHDARLVNFYKYDNGLVQIPTDPAPTLSAQPHGTRYTQQHNRVYTLVQPSTDTYKHSFFPRTIKDWNRLDEDVVSAPDANIFGTRLLC